VKKLRQQINQLTSSGAKPTLQEAIAFEEQKEQKKLMDQKIAELSTHIEYLEDKLDEVVSGSGAVVAGQPPVVRRRASKVQDEPDSGTPPEQMPSDSVSNNNNSNTSVTNNDNPAESTQGKRRKSKVEEEIKKKREKNRRLDELFIADKVQELLADHPTLQKFGQTISNTHDLFAGLQGEVNTLAAQVATLAARPKTPAKEEPIQDTDELRTANQFVDNLQVFKDDENRSSAYTWKRGEMDDLRESLKQITTALESKANKKAVIQQERRLTQIEDNVEAILTNKVDKKDAQAAAPVNMDEILDSLMNDPRFNRFVNGATTPKSKPATPKESSSAPSASGPAGHQDDDLRGEVDRISRRLYATREELANLAKELADDKKSRQAISLGMKRGQSFVAIEDNKVEAPSSDASRALTAASKKEKDDGGVGVYKDSQVALLKKGQEYLGEVSDSHSKDIRTLFGAIKELSDLLEEKADAKKLHDLEDSRELIKEDILKLKADLEQKADKLDNQQLSLALKKVTVDFQDLKDESVLRGVIEQLSSNINLLFETKADAQLVQRALQEKGDAKVLATKANRSYCEALVERVTKSLNQLSTKVDNLASNSTFHSEIQQQIAALKKALQNKADREELLQHLTSVIESTSTAVAPVEAGLEATVSRSKLPVMYCLSCDRPLTRFNPTPSQPAVPLLPSAPPSAHNRGSYEVEYYRKERKKRRYLLNHSTNKPSQILILVFLVQAQLVEQGSQMHSNRSCRKKENQTKVLQRMLKIWRTKSKLKS
jgi:hypothetical protein